MPDNRYENAPRPGQERFVAPPEDVRVGVVDAVDTSEAPSSLWSDAWRDMRRRPLFWVSAALIVFVVLMATVPGLFTSVNPRECHLENSLGGPTAGHIFGFDKQGCVRALEAEQIEDVGRIRDEERCVDEHERVRFCAVADPFGGRG
jgi:oligopeptide transport system permease protein